MSGKGYTVTAETAEKPVEKIGLERFLQVTPQQRGICAVLRSRYAAEVKTRTDWEIAVKNLLNRKTT